MMNNSGALTHIIMEYIAVPVKNWGLIWSLFSREITARYKESIFGVFWALALPFFMLIIYTFVFSVIFKSKWISGSDSKAEFSLILFSGLIVFNIFSECLSRAPNLIIGHSNFVKKVVFPLEILPWIVVLSAIYTAIMSLSAWMIAYIILIGFPHITWIYIPLIFMPIVFYSLGILWLISSLGVYIRDISQFISLIISILIFASPVFYPISAVPKEFQFLMLLNPLTSLIEEFRNILFWGNQPEWNMILIQILTSLVFSFICFCWFKFVKKGFSDVI